MAEVKLNNKELIKRTKELIALIENNELANDLTNKLRITEQDILDKEKYEKELKKWKEEGFRKNEIYLKSIIDYGNSRGGKLRLCVIRDEQHYHNEIKIKVILTSNNVMICREDLYELEIYADRFKERLEDCFGRILQFIFDSGINFLTPKPIIEVKQKEEEEYNYNILSMKNIGMQIQRPTQYLNTMQPSSKVDIRGRDTQFNYNYPPNDYEIR